VASLVREMSPAIRPLLDLPYVLHGHSMGALLAFETARALQDMAGPPPAGLVVSGMVAPANWPVRPPTHRLDTAQLVARAEELFGLAREITGDEDVLALLLPVLRADLEVAETYRYRPGRRLACPVTVLAGAHDRAARPPDVRGWREVTTGDFSLRVFDGGHFFLHECPEVVDDVAARCARFVAQALSTLE
jgi:medium-chain acyl-[acyl-carrier-protein] hydrolase